MISLLSNPKQMVFAAQTHTMACEYLSLDVSRLGHNMKIHELFL